MRVEDGKGGVGGHTDTAARLRSESLVRKRRAPLRFVWGIFFDTGAYTNYCKRPLLLLLLPPAPPLHLLLLLLVSAAAT